MNPSQSDSTESLAPHMPSTITSFAFGQADGNLELCVLAAADVGESILPVLGWLLAIVFVGAIAMYWIGWWRRRAPSDQIGFTLSDLREMRESGDITEHEFQAARDAMIAQVKRQSTAKLVDGKYTPDKKH